MQIIKTSAYKQDLKKKIINKHLAREMNKILGIESLIISKNNMQEVMNDPLKNVYKIEKKQGNLKTYYTAKLNGNIRLFLKPVGSYPYNLIEIEKVEFNAINDKHYKEG